MYRPTPTDRLYVCPVCASAASAPLHGGQVACSRCRATCTLPDRSELLRPAMMPPMPSDDPMRIAQLRVQDGRPRIPSPTLQAVLGGTEIQPGREQEAMLIWQSLRARAQQGDVAASEDMSLLTLQIAQLPSMQSQPELTQALSESALDAAVLPRHRQEQLGKLCRLAAVQGDRARLLGLLSLMNPAANDLDSDSEYRVSAAIAAAMERDGRRMLALLGPQKDAIPIDDSLDPLASVLRAHAYEVLGDVTAAAQILRELPNPRMLQFIQGHFGSLGLCPQSSGAYVQGETQEGSLRAAASAGGIGITFGLGLGLVGLIMLVVAAGIATGGDGIEAAFVNGGIGAVLFVIGAVLFVRGRAKGRHAAWLRVHGLPLAARIVNAQPTGTMINDVPIFRFMLQVAGPQGPYAASFNKLQREHEVALLLGRDVRVRANPTKLSEVILEE